MRFGSVFPVTIYHINFITNLLFHDFTGSSYVSTLSHNNTLILVIFASVDLLSVYSLIFSNFTENYETVANASIQMIVSINAY